MLEIVDKLTLTSEVNVLTINLNYKLNWFYRTLFNITLRDMRYESDLIS